MCDPSDHNYTAVPGGSYFKRNADLEGTAMDSRISYKRIFCTKCGVSKEVIAADHKSGDGNPMVKPKEIETPAALMFLNARVTPPEDGQTVWLLRGGSAVPARFHSGGQQRPHFSLLDNQESVDFNTGWAPLVPPENMNKTNSP